MLSRLAQESMQTAVGCFLACGFLQLAGLTLKAVQIASLGGFA